MNIGNLKTMLAVAVAAVGMTAVADPTVTVGEVENGEPWSTITVNYILGGTDAKLDYKVAFDVTAGRETASVTNDAAKLADGAATKEIDTVALFGKQVSDTKAKVKVTLIALKPKAAGGVQLWKDGPFWAECNVGGTVPGDYGELYTFNDDKAKKAAESLGAGWRLPTQAELKALLDNCDRTWETCKDGMGADRAGCRFTGKDSYSSNSIFLPAAGFDDGSGRDDAGVDGNYWSSGADDDDVAWYLCFGKGFARVDYFDRSLGLSVRAVR